MRDSIPEFLITVGAEGMAPYYPDQGGRFGGNNI
jgi:hypothetical protein